MRSALACLNSQDLGPGEVVAEILRRHRSHLRELWLEVALNCVVIRGVTTSYYGKQLPLHEVRRRCGLRVSANRIVVIDVVPPRVPSDPVGG